jgi:hypothetical protein
MGYHLEIIDHESVFQSLDTPPIIVNDLNLTSIKDKEEFNALVTTQYEGDTLSNIPMCDCGTTRGQYNIGRICDDCGTPVEHITTKKMESRIWITVPEGVSALINPQCYSILHASLKHTGCNLLEWLTNPNYRPTNNNLPVLNKLKMYNFNRGLNAFYGQFDDIVSALVDINAFKGNKRTRKVLHEFILMYRDCIFTKVLQIPSRVTFVTEKTPMAEYADPTTAKALDAIRTISSIRSSITPLTLKQREMVALTAITQLAEYHDGIKKNSLASKRGMYRKHVCGSRLHHSFRCVITSLSENHDPRELHTPWGLTLNVLKVHVASKMLRLGYTIKDAYAHITKHINKFCPILNEIMEELIVEARELGKEINGGKIDEEILGFPVCFQRNPSLRRGSAQQFFITKFFKDPNILTAAMSTLVLTAPNADFDGKRLPSLNPFNCWELLRAFLPQISRKQISKV